MVQQFLSFYLQNTLYAVEVSQVQEVLDYTPPVKLPCTENYVEGLISSRGKGIAVVNLRKKFGLDFADITKKTRIIVLEIKTNNEENEIVAFGGIADSVVEVIEIDDQTIELAPKFGNSISAEFIKGIGKKNDEFIIILDIDKVFSFDEIQTLKNV